MNAHYPPIEEFSEQYFVMPDIDVREYTGDRVAASSDLYRELMGFVTAPLVKLSTGHYWLRTEWGIPGDTIAIPHDADGDELGSPALLAKDHTTKTLLHQGVIDQP